MGEQPKLGVKLLRDGAKLPTRAHDTDSGADAYACLEKDGTVFVGQYAVKIPLGIACEIPAGYELQIRPRSSLSAKGVHVALGTCDQSYRGELCAVMWTTGEGEYEVNDGDKICQLVLAPVLCAEIVAVEALSETARADKGFGSSGTR